jgi:hypothetical protein
MIRLLLAALSVTCALSAQAASGTCRIAGTAFDYAGQPMPMAVVRLVDRQTHQTSYRAADAKARFEFSDVSADTSGYRYRLDVLSDPTVVTGTHIRTRSVVGVAPTFTCGGDQTAQVDVKVEVR